jgi:competence ComEA-like helix-hairpin-helix protein
MRCVKTVIDGNQVILTATKKDIAILKYIILLLLSAFELFALVELNSATEKELLELNGVGKAKSLKIIHYKEVNGCFKSLDELARVEGISENIVSSNRAILTLGVCQKVDKEVEVTSMFKDVLLNPVNIIFVIFIFILAFLDQKTGRNFKSQIVSLGVLGTFVGIFIGLQGFDPGDIVNSVNDILVGLKTAFFTSIVGMGVSTILSIIEKLKGDTENE